MLKTGEINKIIIHYIYAFYDLYCMNYICLPVGFSIKMADLIYGKRLKYPLFS